MSGLAEVMVTAKLSSQGSDAVMRLSESFGLPVSGWYVAAVGTGAYGKAALGSAKGAAAAAAAKAWITGIPVCDYALRP